MTNRKTENWLKEEWTQWNYSWGTEWLLMPLLYTTRARRRKGREGGVKEGSRLARAYNKFEAADWIIITLLCYSPLAVRRLIFLAVHGSGENRAVVWAVLSICSCFTDTILSDQLYLHKSITASVNAECKTVITHCPCLHSLPMTTQVQGTGS